MAPDLLTLLNRLRGWDGFEIAGIEEGARPRCAGLASAAPRDHAATATEGGEAVQSPLRDRGRRA